MLVSRYTASWLPGMTLSVHEPGGPLMWIISELFGADTVLWSRTPQARMTMKIVGDAELVIVEWSMRNLALEAVPVILITLFVVSAPPPVPAVCTKLKFV